MRSTNNRNPLLLVSGFGIICIALVYGANPHFVAPLVFGIEINSIELSNVFRAIMGLYAAFGFFWLSTLFYYRNLQKPAIISVACFMGGLAAGRLISFLFDGFSFSFFIGFILELTLTIWAIIDLKVKRNSKSPVHSE